ncbi:MAG: aminotransferase class I/II-fold pyridoxal phosphate-dependent enzyme [Oscillospiraceae bacterium]
MYNFINDYSEGAHENIINALIKTNREQTVGYCEDEYCAKAAKLIQKELGHKRAVHFMVAGTQTNLTVISHVLRPYEGAIAPITGHINVHESGAIEATGHKVLTVPTDNGKLTAGQVTEVMEEHLNNPTMIHMVRPGMVYISLPTEIGTIYSKNELSAIYDACKKYKIPLFIDGARLGCALSAPKNDLTLKDLAELCDIFYIGGTKMGALFGEALVINNPKYDENFQYMQKQKGALLAKGRLLGIQFEQLFTDRLYYKLGEHAVSMAQKIQNCLIENDYKLKITSDTNQLFPIFEDKALAALEKEFTFEFWEKADRNHSTVRICTSWATEEAQVEKICSMLTELKG